MSRLGKLFRSIASIHALRQARALPACRVLVTGVFLRDKVNFAPEIVAGTASRRHHVDHLWASVGTGNNRTEEMKPFTALEYGAPVPKFTVINELLRSRVISAYDYIVVTDDDIELGPGFLDDFIGLQAYCGFSLAQPARSQQSNVDHPVTLESHARIARQTRFVEIGPLFSMAGSAFPHLLPFDEAFYMGWGLDRVWPLALEQAGLAQGVIDLTPIHHRMRPVAATYSGERASRQMAAALSGRETIAARDTVLPRRSIWW